MKTTLHPILLTATLVFAIASPSAPAQGLPTTGTLQSPLGPLEIKNGYPTQPYFDRSWVLPDIEQVK